MKLLRDQRGIALVVEIIIGAIVVLALAIVGLKVYSAHHKAATAPASSLSAAKTSSTNSVSGCSTGTTMYVTATDGLKLRSDKNTSSIVVSIMPYAAGVLAGCSDGNWYKVNYQGQTGYASTQYLSASKPLIKLFDAAAEQQLVNNWFNDYMDNDGNNSKYATSNMNSSFSYTQFACGRQSPPQALKTSVTFKTVSDKTTASDVLAWYNTGDQGINGPTYNATFSFDGTNWLINSLTVKACHP